MPSAQAKYFPWKSHVFPLNNQLRASSLKDIPLKSRAPTNTTKSVHSVFSSGVLHGHEQEHLLKYVSSRGHSNIWSAKLPFKRLNSNKKYPWAKGTPPFQVVMTNFSLDSTSKWRAPCNTMVGFIKRELRTQWIHLDGGSILSYTISEGLNHSTTLNMSVQISV